MSREKFLGLVENAIYSCCVQCDSVDGYFCDEMSHDFGPTMAWGRDCVFSEEEAWDCVNAWESLDCETNCHRINFSWDALEECQEVYTDCDEHETGG